MSYQFKCFYDILQEALMGKVVVMRNYENDGEEYVWPEDDNGPPVWNEDAKFVEWQGRVVDVLQNDNSRVDIIFARDEHHKPPKKKPGEFGEYLEDCYNWHMNSYVRVLQ